MAAAAEELEVDIEGDPVAVPGEAVPGDRENTASSLLQDHYLDSSWRTGNSLPWTLDSSISEENRAVIEKMLLEEDPHKKAGKVMVRSLTKSAGYPLKWTSEEKELFEQGLVKFGRRWTKIAKLIGSRTVLQVKSYARQYFKNKAKKIQVDFLEKVICA